MSIYSKHFNTKKTPQTQPIPGKAMVQNEAGGFSFEANAWTKFNRYLVLGTEGGTYYTTENKLTVENAKNTIEVIKSNGVEAVKQIVNVSVEGRAPKNDAAIFALALASAFGDVATKQAAYAAISQVCRTGTHLFAFTEAVQGLRGWSRGLRNGVAKFYTDKDSDKLAYQLIKYRQRNGWTHKDVLRLSHAKPQTLIQNDLFKYAIGKGEESLNLNPIIEAFEVVQSLGTSDVNSSIQLIKEFRLPWEAIPTTLLNDKKVWDALLQDMPLTAMVRNLGKMTSVGVLDNNLSNNVKIVKNSLQNVELLKKSKMHPMQLLLALKTYEQGHGMKGSLSWTPLQSVVDSLNDAFYDAFGNVIPTNKNTLVAVDFSGSMSANLGNFPISAREAAVAMALVTLNVEPNVEVVGYDENVYKANFSAKQRIDDALKKIQTHGCGTNSSLPFVYALKSNIHVDSFISFTDTQSWNGAEHVSQALNAYRKGTGVLAKSVEVVMTACNTTNVDPDDVNALTVIGFDTNTPQAISTFLGT